MKHKYLFFSILFCSFLNAQIINFPDANFKAKLLQANSSNMIAYDSIENSITIDANSNGEIEVSEIQNVVGLNVNNSAISDLTGISNFVNLKWLRCANNSLTELVIDNSIVIKSLEANNNAISSILINFDDDEIYSIDLRNNNLTNFTLENCNYLEVLYLNNNEITSLVLGNVLIDYFGVSYNNLSDIQFIGNVRFYQTASFSNNQFTLLDLSDVNFQYDAIITLGNNIEDKVLFGDYKPGNIEYSSNNITFDLGNFYGTRDCDPEYMGNVTILNSPNLQNVILKNGFNHGYITCNEGGTIFQTPAMNLQISNCQSLTHVCVDEGFEQTAIQERINQLGLQNQVVVDSNCSSIVLGTESIVFDEQITIFPVPVQTILQIEIKNNSVINSIEICNNLGQIIQNENANNRNIDVSKLASGSYFLKIKTEEESFIKQFLKE